MKVTITCMFARVTVELDAQDAMDLMLRAVQKAAPGLPYDQGVDIRAMEPPEEETREDTAECPRGGDSTEPEIITQPVIPKKARQKMYKGFLHLQCDPCGEVKSMCVKVPISAYQCKCGAETSLLDLVDLNVKCRCCGKYFQYRTNLKAQTTTVNCLGCGAPVDLEYHDKNQEYVSI